MHEDEDKEKREAREQVRKVLTRFDPQKESLIPILQGVQAEMGYIPASGMEEVARFLSIPQGKVHGVATFYNQFRLTPPGKYHVKRSYVILEEWRRRLEIQDGQTTPDRLFGLERVACVGCCALAPVVVMSENGTENFHGHMMTSKVNGLILEVERKEKDGPGS
jgi:NADH-quinone oxidoreductase subunit E